MTGKSYQNIHDLLHDLYVSTGRGIARHARYVEWSARKLLEKTRIDGNLSRAQTLLRLHKRLQRSASEVGDPEFEEQFEVYRLLIECHEVLVDDLLLQAAFENYARAC